VQQPAEQVATAQPAEPPRVTTAAPADTAAPQAQPARNSRGLFLLVMGLIGVGLLALMMRTPRESQPMTIITPAEPEKPAAPVEPLRRPNAAAPGPDQTRKTGS
jgi:hypothetical protein